MKKLLKTENPYAPPNEAKDEAPIRLQGIIKFSPGTIVFAILGLALVSLGCVAIVAAYRDSRIPTSVHLGITCGGAWIAVLGLVLIVHGLTRHETTIKLALILLVLTGVAIMATAAL